MLTKTKKSILIAMTKMGYIPLALIIGCFLANGVYAQDKQFDPKGNWGGLKKYMAEPKPPTFASTDMQKNIT